MAPTTRSASAIARAMCRSVAFDRFLVYAICGVAFGNIETPSLDGLNDWRTGWTVGGGVEYPFAKDWSARIDYRYSDLGSVSATDPLFNATNDNTLDFHTVRFGVSYRFGGVP